MKIVYDEKYNTVYASDPAAGPGRMEAIYKELRGYEFVKPQPASLDDLRLAHGKEHIDSIRRDRRIYDTAILAVGGAITASKIASEGEPSFGLIRPPGHHASKNSCWGFCFFNNMAIAILRLMKEKKVKNPLILDIDLHTGDGTINILKEKATILNPISKERKDYIEEISNVLSGRRYDIIGISAGFDNYMKDWGGLLATEDYFKIGELTAEFSKEYGCGSFALLEGGYYLEDLGKNAKALIDGMRS